jgi:hypothetical protein
MMMMMISATPMIKFAGELDVSQTVGGDQRTPLRPS